LEDASHYQGAFTNFDRKKLHPSLSTIASGHTKVPPMALYIIPTMFIRCSGRGIFCASQALKEMDQLLILRGKVNLSSALKKTSESKVGENF